MSCKRAYSIISSFIPRHEPLDNKNVWLLQERLDDIGRLLVITGAGLSTESGIPDYRSEKVGRYFTSKTRPIEYATFLNNSEARRRYWARNYVGWPSFSKSTPNINHIMLRGWEVNQRLHWLITQNVDDLHRKAGTQRLTELHGSTFRVVCLKCRFSVDRHTFQNRIAEANSHFDIQAVKMAPDGDVDLSDEHVQSFKTPQCPQCSGIVKPDVVFFGDNVDRKIVEFCFDKVDTADGILVLGSSLHVYSGYRFVKRMAERSKPVLIVNIGPTRADELASLKISTKCGDIIPLIRMTPKGETYKELPK